MTMDRSDLSEGAYHYRRLLELHQRCSGIPSSLKPPKVEGKKAMETVGFDVCLPPGRQPKPLWKILMEEGMNVTEEGLKLREDGMKWMEEGLELREERMKWREDSLKLMEEGRKLMGESMKLLEGDDSVNQQQQQYHESINRCASMAIDVYNKEHNAQYQFMRVVQLSSLAIAGFDHYITFEAKVESAAPMCFQALVYEGIPEDLIVVEFCRPKSNS